jgi:hypothetical protein
MIAWDRRVYNGTFRSQMHWIQHMKSSPFESMSRRVEVNALGTTDFVEINIGVELNKNRRT